MEWVRSNAIDYCMDVDKCLEGNDVIHSYYSDRWHLACNYYWAESDFAVITFELGEKSFRNILKEVMMNAIDKKGFSYFKDVLLRNNHATVSVDIDSFVGEMYEKGVKI